MRHIYFAYGSNLCVRQMARRCPGAADPRPATLADHDWLINERGVATVEQFDGSQVHGVVWQLTDTDLATLDSAEGVPVRYRRDRLTVHTDDGPYQAWVYIDHRVEPGPPRPGYLERVVDGALQHGLPQRWIDFLRRWDPTRWPGSMAHPSSAGPQSLSELLADPGVVEELTLRSRFGFMAFHGGGLEQMTDVIAERAADAADASLYVVRHPDQYPHHLSSARYDPRSPNDWPSSSTMSMWWCRCTATAASVAAHNCSPVAATADWPNMSRTTSPFRGIRWSPTSTPYPVSCGSASGEPGEPGAPGRHPARTHAAGTGHQPAQPAAR